MRADKIFKNAKIFTADKDHPQASAIAVKDGKFVYVGDEAGLSDYEGEVLTATSMLPCRSDFSMRTRGCALSATANRKRWLLLRTM